MCDKWGHLHVDKYIPGPRVFTIVLQNITRLSEINIEFSKFGILKLRKNRIEIAMGFKHKFWPHCAVFPDLLLYIWRHIKEADTIQTKYRVFHRKVT